MPPRLLSPSRLPTALLVLSASLGVTGCGRGWNPLAEDKSAFTPVDALTHARFVREGEEALRHIGIGDFEVESCKAGTQKPIEFVDDFDFHTRFQALAMECRYRWVRDVSVRSKGELMAWVGASDWTIRESEFGMERLSALGEGFHKAGSVDTRAMSAMFSDLEPGFRFAALDHPR